MFQIFLALSSNALEVYNIPAPNKGKDGPVPEASRTLSLDLPGHRTDVRALALSSDDALLASVSANYFATLLPPTDRSPDGYPLARSQDTSDVLNIVLHAVYDMSPARYAPPVTTLLAALDRLPAYGMLPAQHVVPPRALYAVLLAQAPLAPLAVYTAAARYGLNDLAVAVSSHLLSFPLPALTDAQAEAMGAIYLKRLFMLHKQRVDALKGVLAQAPYPHPETEICTFADQKKIARAWQLAATYLVAEAQPGENLA